MEERRCRARFAGAGQIHHQPTERALCLRSYLGLASNPDMPAGQRLAMCREAAPLAQKPGEKKLLLSALGKVQTAESVALIAPYLDDATTKEEASAAVVAIAERLAKDKCGEGHAPSGGTSGEGGRDHQQRGSRQAGRRSGATGGQAGGEVTLRDRPT